MTPVVVPKRHGHSVASPRLQYMNERRGNQSRFHNMILARDDHRCVKCGRTRNELSGVPPDEAKLFADHIIPVALGGTDTPDNGQTLCALHNRFFGWQARYKTGGKE